MGYRMPRLQAGRMLDFTLKMLLDLKVFDMARRVNRSLLTVLNYHRIDDPHRSDFDTFKPNVSATPEEFARQMDYVQSRYSVITCLDLVMWLKGECTLPPCPLLITFDDGYFDNYKYAAPILRERNLPATIFLSTGFMGTGNAFYWDYVAYLFFHTKRNAVHLPHLGEVAWRNAASRERVMHSWINTVKFLPDEQRRQAVAEMEKVLDVKVTVDAFSGLYLGWEQLKELSENGFELGAHTVNHPILSRIPVDRVDEELIESRKQIEKRIGKSVISFAYPNGLAQDISKEVVNSVRKAGMLLAFTLMPGPVSLRKVRTDPLLIRRIFLIHSDSFPRFVAKLAGLNKLL